MRSPRFLGYHDAGAEISPCGTYRYLLWRDWRDGDLFDVDDDMTALWVMANPSTGNAVADDPTIRRVVDFSMRLGCSRAEIVNWAAYRATRPDAVHQAHRNGVDIRGPDNDVTIERALDRSPCLRVAAWGGAPPPIDMPTPLVKLWATGAMKVLDLTASGAPRHPLYVPRSAVAGGLRSVREMRDA